MSALVKKLLMKPGKKWLLFNAPENYLATLGELPEGTAVAYKPVGSFDGMQVFVKNLAELATTLKKIQSLLKVETILWIIYPKKSSGIASDLEMMGSWEEVQKHGLRIVASAAIDDTWTALRFRPLGVSKISEGGNDAIRQNEFSAFIDVDNKQVKLPPVMMGALQKQTNALAFFHHLSYSNKKEYVLWILTAKQDKTRNERLVKLVEKLNAGKKNPSEK